MKMIENESGRFYIDDFGALQRFECGAKNSLKLPYIPESKSLFCLHIPEGVRILPANAFRGFSVMRELTLPDSLQVLSEGAFSRCKLGSVALPKYAELGTDIFSGSKIGTVTIPEGMTPGLACQAAHALRYSEVDTVKDWPKEYADIFYGKNELLESWKQISNLCGTFFVDSDGVLREFLCDQYNLPRDCCNDKEKVILRLNIPEGVKVIPGELFARYTVLWELTFPDSLKCIGNTEPNAFARSRLPDVVLPKNLELLGHFSFGGSTIRSLTIPGTLHGSLSYPECVRDFKDSIIGEIRMPAEYKALLEELSKTWHYGNYEMECGELSDAELGRLCYVKPKNGLLRGGEIVPNLLRAIVAEA